MKSTLLLNLKRFYLKFTILALITLISNNAYCFDAITHLWIAQQVINDIVPDGKLTIDGKEYPVDGDIVQALQKFPNQFRMGCLGPDIFPDPLVGQMTTHPGLEGGWRTDEWIMHLIRESYDNYYEEIAFAFGYACHAAADIFAHTYINSYTGDIFSLADEQEVEIRHFVLEKYIGMKIPEFKDYKGNPLPSPENLITVPTSFVTRSLILNSKVRAQYMKPDALALHLAGMSGIHSTVTEMEGKVEEVANILNNLVIDFYKKQLEYSIKLEENSLKLMDGKVALESARVFLDEKEKALKLARAAIEAQKSIIDLASKAIDVNSQIILVQSKIIDDCTSAAINLNNELNETSKNLISVNNDILRFPGEIWVTVSELVCNKYVRNIPFLGDIVDEVCNWRPAQRYNREYQKLIDVKEKYENKIVDLQRDISNNALKRANAIQLKAAANAEILIQSANKTTAEAALKAAEEEYRAAQNAFDIAEKAYNEAEVAYNNLNEIQKVILNELNVVIAGALDKLSHLLKDLNPLVVILRNWEHDIENATEAYINVGQDFAIEVVKGNSGGLSLYQDWMSCWAPVFGGVPEEIPNTSCEIQNSYKALQEQVDKILAEMGDLEWLVYPSGKLKKEILDVLQPKLEQLLIQLSESVFGEDMVTMIELLSGRQKVTENYLNEVFSFDNTNKSLLIIPNISKTINQDLGLSSQDELDPDNFNALFNAIVLSKLCLLSSRELNKLYFNYTKEKKTIYGDGLYDDHIAIKFSILDKAVSSIDGSCQWQNVALPYPRLNNLDPNWPSNRKYGVAFNKASLSGGFRFWEDPNAREKVFLKIFKGPITPGLFNLSIPSITNYPFRACIKNPFPETQDKNGNILNSDPKCNN